MSSDLRNVRAERARCLWAPPAPAAGPLVPPRRQGAKFLLGGRRRVVPGPGEEFPAPDFIQLVCSERLLEFTHRKLLTRETLSRGQLAERLSQAVESLVELRKALATETLAEVLGEFRKFFEKLFFEKGKVRRPSPEDIERAMGRPPPGIFEETFLKVAYHVYAELTTLFFRAKQRAVRACLEQGRLLNQRYLREKRKIYHRHALSFSFAKDSNDHHIRLIGQNEVDPSGLKVNSFAAVLGASAVGNSCVNQSYLKLFSASQFRSHNAPSAEGNLSMLEL